MAIVVEASQKDLTRTDAGGTSPITWDVPSCVVGEIILFARHYPFGFEPVLGTPNVGGVNFTSIGSIKNTNNSPKSDVWWFKVTSAGTNTISFTHDAAGSGSTKFTLIAARVSGVDGTTPINGTPQTLQQDGPTLQLTITSATGNMAFVTGATGDTGDSTAAGGATLDQSGRADTINLNGAMAHIAGAASVSPGLTNTASHATLIGWDMAAANTGTTVTPTGFGLSTTLGSFTTQADTTLTGVTGYSLTSSLGTPTFRMDKTITVTGFGLTALLGSVFGGSFRSTIIGIRRSIGL